MAEIDLIKLYSERILALTAEIPFTDPIEAPEATASVRSPLCGSEVAVAMKTHDGRITAFSQNVRACALGQASAAIAGQVAIGRSRADIARARDELAAFLKEKAPVPAAPYEGYETLTPAQDFPARHASILLVLEAMLGAFDNIK